MGFLDVKKSPSLAQLALLFSSSRVQVVRRAARLFVSLTVCPWVLGLRALMFSLQVCKGGELDFLASLHICKAVA